MLADIPGWGSLQTHALIDDEPTIFAATAGTTEVSVLMSPTTAANALNERTVMARLMQAPHQHVVEVLFVQTAPEHMIYGLQPIHTFRSIFDRVTTDGPLTALASKAYVPQICAALDHLHVRNILHRNLTPENVLVNTHDQIKLSAFSSAAPQLSAVTLCGTPEYTAPEVLLTQPYTHTCDWWSLGCLVCEMLTGGTPFGGERMVVDLLRSILHDPIVMPVHVHVAPEDETFVHALLTRDPSVRLGADGADQVLSHAWLRARAHEQA